MIMLTKEQLADLLRESHDSGFKLGGKVKATAFGSEAYHHFREKAIQPLVHRSSSDHGDSERFAWMIEKAQTGSIGFGEFVLYPGDALEDVRAVIDYAMASTQEEEQ